MSIILGKPTVAEQLAAGCGDGHDPATATGVCTRCGFDCYGYYEGWDLS